MEAEADVGEAGAGFSWLVPTALGFIFLTFNSAAAIHHRSNGDAGAITFMVWQYMVNLVLVLLFLCLRLFERAPPGSLTREKLKVSVWVLTTFPTTVLTYMIAVSIPVPVQVLLAWGVAGATGLGGFYAFFLHNNEGKDDDVDAIAPNGRVKKVLGYVLAALRWRLPQPAAAGLAQDPHDIAWSGARLIVDSGATRHAVGNVLLLDGFQRYSPPLVATLADGSNLRILGVGRIQRGEFSIPNVCLVEGLKDALISTQQLDSDHGLISCFGNGICRIMQADGTEVGGAILEEGGYMLRFLNVP